MVAMYTALGAVEDPRYPGGDALILAGFTICFQEIDSYVPPKWPDGQPPSQMHLDFFVDAPDDTEIKLYRLGASTATISRLATAGSSS